MASADYNQDNLAPPFSTRNVTLQRMPVYHCRSNRDSFETPEEEDIAAFLAT